MNLMIDIPPDEVSIGGRKYRINSDFRASVLFELLMQDEDVPDREKVIQAIDLYFTDPPYEEDPKEIFRAISWFYRCGRSDKEPDKKSRNENEDDQEEGEADDTSKADSERAYSYDYDDEYIFAAFMQQYGIDLSTAENLHWWKFRALFKGLDPDCQFCKIMGYRTARITKEMSKGEKAFLRKMKSLHALPKSKKKQEEQEGLEYALMHGGDVSEVLARQGM